MRQTFAFTTAAMAAALEDTPVSYEDLAEIEREFDDVETEISMFIFAFFSSYSMTLEAKNIYFSGLEGLNAPRLCYNHIRSDRSFRATFHGSTCIHTYMF